MTVKEIKNIIRIELTYIEWIGLGKILPPSPSLELNKKTEYTIRNVPEDRKEYFENLGCKVRLAKNRGRGRSIF